LYGREKIEKRDFRKKSMEIDPDIPGRLLPPSQKREYLAKGKCLKITGRRLYLILKS